MSQNIKASFADYNGQVMCFITDLDGTSPIGTTVLRLLNTEQKSRFRLARAENLTDSQVFARVFPDDVPESPAKVDLGKFADTGRAVYAVMNWPARTSPADSAVLKLLPDDQASEYHKLRKRGLGETEVFEALFPPQRAAHIPDDAPEIPVPVTMLSKDQLLTLIERRLGAATPSFQRAARADLERTVTALFAKDRPSG